MIYETGAKRSDRHPRYDLIPKEFWNRIAQRFTGEIIHLKPTGGALKYGECNWEKGLPTSDVINHLVNHLINYTNEFREVLKRTNGDMELVRHHMRRVSELEDHLGGIGFAIAVLMYQENNGMFHDDLFEKPSPVENKSDNSGKSPRKVSRKHRSSRRR